MTPSAHVRVLGTAQDAGLPQLGCLCPTCEGARADPRRARTPAALAVTASSGRTLLVDATLAITAQAARLVRTPERPLGFDEVLLTHAHVGHVLGLPLLGREGASTRHLPVRGTPAMLGFLRGQRPFAHLVARGEIDLVPVVPGASFDLDDVRVETFASPHRSEDTDTLGLTIRGPARTVVYVPDADRFDDDLVARIAAADVALVDGTFHDPDELPGRDLAAIPHPFVTDSVRRLARAAGRVRFTHLNHSNSLLHPEPARRSVLPAGFAIAEEGERHELGRG